MEGACVLGLEMGVELAEIGVEVGEGGVNEVLVFVGVFSPYFLLKFEAAGVS